MTGGLALELVQDLENAGYGGKEAVLQRWEQQIGKSRSTLLRWAKKAGYKAQERQTRADAGISRAGVTDQALQHVVGLMVGSRRQTGSIEMPTSEAVDECIRAGVLPPGTKTSTVCRILRERGASRRDIRANYTIDGQDVSAAHIKLMTLYPNHMHEVDVSACLHWYFKKKGGLGTRHRTLELAGGKKVDPYRKIRDHILRYLMIDHNTGQFYARYYYAAGETALNMADFLRHGWTRREHPHDIFHGVPSILYMDPGSANTAAIIGNLLDHLQVQKLFHRPGVARATGMVECYQRIWQQTFESKLFIRPPENIDELNERADQARISYCFERIHSGHKKSRAEAWAAIRPDQLRLCPPESVYNELVHEKPHRTKVRGDGIIRWKGSRAGDPGGRECGPACRSYKESLQTPRIIGFCRQPGRHARGSDPDQAHQRRTRSGRGGGRLATPPGHPGPAGHQGGGSRGRPGHLCRDGIRPPRRPGAAGQRAAPDAPGSGNRGAAAQRAAQTGRREQRAPGLVYQHNRPL